MLETHRAGMRARARSDIVLIAGSQPTGMALPG
jgi:hypothetical protein